MLSESRFIFLSFSLGYRWNPRKCVLVTPSSDARIYKLYDTDIPKDSYFSYRGVPIKPEGFIDYANLVQRSINKASLSMNQLASIGVNSKGFSHLLSSRFYCQIVRSQMDYGLAISPISAKLVKQLELFQNSCIRRIFGGHSTSSAKVMLQLVNLPTMKTRVSILQAQYNDSLLATLFPYLRQQSNKSHWYKLCKTKMWFNFCVNISNEDLINHGTFIAAKRSFLLAEYNSFREATDSILLSTCRPSRQVDPILWLPMTNSERSLFLRWRLGWLPGGKPKDCILHPGQHWSRRHSFECLNVLNRLFLPTSIDGPISFLLNLLPKTKPRSTALYGSWKVRWPLLCQVLHELDFIFHDECPPPTVDPVQKMLKWILEQ